HTFTIIMSLAHHQVGLLDEASCENRKCLGVLDSNLPNQSRIMITSNTSLKHHFSSRGKKRKSSENCDITKTKRKDRIYEDPIPPLVKKKTTFVAVAVQTDKMHPSINIVPDESKVEVPNISKVDKTINMLTCDNAPSEYWESLAEKRRIALEETLTENHRLHEENVNLKQEVSELKKENTLLEEMIDEAKHLALLVESLTGEVDSKEHQANK
ncbi:hypothetical protein OTU49_016369, partial [Cherax quadricarinatus]